MPSVRVTLPEPLPGCVAVARGGDDAVEVDAAAVDVGGVMVADCVEQRFE
jgi:hypothetical protein